MSVMINTVQTEKTHYQTLCSHLNTVKCISILGFTLSVIWLLVMIELAVQLFATHCVYLPAVMAALLSQISFIFAYVLFIKNRKCYATLEASTFFAILGLGFFMLSICSCLLHSLPIAHYVTEQLQLLNAR